MTVIAGSYQDHYKDVFKGNLLHVAQQEGSRLMAITMSESMDGNKTYFDIDSKVEVNKKTGRNQLKVYTDGNYQRRYIQEEFFDFNRHFDREDMIKFVDNPKNSVSTAAVWAMGRKEDEIIMGAISGAANIIENGVASTAAISLTVALADHTYDSGSGDVSLTVGKLKKAKVEIMESYGANPNTRLICIAPESQLVNLTKETEAISHDFRSGTPLESPGIVPALSGFLGMDFISYEDTGLTGTDTNVWVLTPDAIRLGNYIPLTVDVDEDKSRSGHPDSLTVFKAFGATRSLEEKVVKIICSPIA